MAHLVPTITHATAADVASLLADRLLRYHGLPKVLVSDRDSRFVAELWREFCQRFDIQRAPSSAWHPESDGQHRTLEQNSHTYISSDEAAREGLLAAVELPYSCTTHSSTCSFSLEVMIGENPLRASVVDVAHNFDAALSPPMTKLFQQLVDRAAADILRAQAQQKHYADAHGQDVSFDVGDLVRVSTKFMQLRRTRKVQPQVVGPFEVLKRVGKVAYLLDLPPSMQVHSVFHVSLLRRNKPRPPYALQPPGWRPVAPAAEDADPVFEVEHLLDSRGSGGERGVPGEVEGISS
ncbi:hypothetical protein Emag_005758 [Eimeria magna]